MWCGRICRVAPFLEPEGNKESRGWRMKIWEAMAQKQDKSAMQEEEKGGRECKNSK